MTTLTIFETLRSRGDLLRGVIAETDTEYLDRTQFFDRRYPAQGLRSVLCTREGRRNR